MKEITSSTRYVGEISADNAIRLYHANNGDICLENNGGDQVIYEGDVAEWMTSGNGNGIAEILACAEELAELLDAEGEDYADAAEWVREHVVAPLRGAIPSTGDDITISISALGETYDYELTASGLSCIGRSNDNDREAHETIDRAVWNNEIEIAKRLKTAVWNCDGDNDVADLGTLKVGGECPTEAEVCAIRPCQHV